MYTKPMFAGGVRAVNMLPTRKNGLPLVTLYVLVSICYLRYAFGIFK